MASRGCASSPDNFCYICGEFVTRKQQRNITDFVKKSYYAYFGVKLGDQDKAWAPHKVCSICVEELRQWTKCTKKSFRFGVPMIWREPKNHIDDCYFCSCKVQGHSSKSRKKILYPSLSSALRPVAHGPDVPVPSPPENIENIHLTSESESSNSNDDVDFNYDCESEEPQLFHQHELNDLVRDLGLAKESAELLGSRLKSKNLLAPGASFSWYHNQEKELDPYFAQENELVYFTDPYEEKPYKCSQCQKTFIEKGKLVQHITVHTGEKPHECSQCQKTFSLRGNLVRHMSLHTGEKPFECSQCQKTFSKRSHLVCHMKLHRGKPSPSDHSGEGSHYKAGLTCHTSFQSKHDYDKMMSSQKSYEDHFISHSASENSGSPQVEKQEVGADFIIYKTDSCPELASIVPEPFIKTEMDDTDIVKTEMNDTDIVKIEMDDTDIVKIEMDDTDIKEEF